ncbi:MAG: hypothetical protein ACI9MC_003742 [Kiritimatiellia bacterium]|jgi:hypothetical protein
MAKLPSDADLASFTGVALRELPISWSDLVVNGRYQVFNPDELDCVVALFGAEERHYIERQARHAGSSPKRVLSPGRMPMATVLSGAAFARVYDRPTHRTLFAMTPFLSRSKDRGLQVVQMEEAKLGDAMVTDHWIFMRQDAAGVWQRRSIPIGVREQLYLTDETGGAP